MWLRKNEAREALLRCGQEKMKPEKHFSDVVKKKMKLEKHFSNATKKK
jgi:hypothetical protein